MGFPYAAYFTALNRTQKTIQDSLASLAELNNIVTAYVANPGVPAATTAPATTAPAASGSLTTFAARDGAPLPDTDAIPDKTKVTLAEWLDFLDDHSLALLFTKTATWPGEGDLLGYIQYRGGYAPNVALAMAKEWGPKYPPTLTHCQILRAIQQSVPYDVPNLARWDAGTRTWLDATGHPYAAQTQWVSAVAGH